jgi:hypothetical protein
MKIPLLVSIHLASILKGFGVSIIHWLREVGVIVLSCECDLLRVEKWKEVLPIIIKGIAIFISINIIGIYIEEIGSVAVLFVKV